MAAGLVGDVMRYVGIDPGLGGCLAVLGGSDGPVVIETPTVEVEARGRRRRHYALDLMWQTMVKFADGEPTVAVLERVSCRPGEGIVSAQRAGEGLGIWEAFLTAAEISYRLVQPAVWKRWAGLLGMDKNMSRLRAAERWPGVELGRVKDHGRADSLWLASYAQSLQW